MFSKTEQKIINLLNKKPKMTLLQIARQVYKGKSQSPRPNRVISALVYRINKKCQDDNLDWMIEGEGRGVVGKTVWIKRISPTP